MDKVEELQEKISELTKELRVLERSFARQKIQLDSSRAANTNLTRMREITEQHLTQQNIYNSLVLQNISDMFVLTDVNGKMLMVSDSVYDKIGVVSSSEIEDLNLLDFFCEKFGLEDIEEVREKIRSVIRDGSSYSVMRRVGFNGKSDECVLNITIRAAHDDKKEVMGIVAVMQDVTEIVEAKERAESSDIAKSNFLANMSHEIRTPMNAITGMSEFIIRDSKDPVAKDNALKIKSASNALLAIINDILDFSKIEAGKMEIIDVDYQPSSLISDIASIISIRLKNKDVALVLDIDENIPYLLNGDEIRIRQVLINLLNNAAKFTNSGEIVLKMWAEPYTDKDKIKLFASVKDSGIGIKAEDIDKLFNSFSQVDTKRNRSVEGTGLGLAISQRMVEAMGGQIKVESEYGKGSTFSFYIINKVIDHSPMGDFKDIKISSEMVFTYTFEAPKAKVLVVDDNSVNLEVVKGMLKPYRINVTAVDNGMSAVNMLKDEHFDIVFMDHMMPVMDGVETLKMIRSMEDHKEDVVIALTANAISGVREMYEREGFHGFLAKPIEDKELDKILLEFLPPETIISTNPKEVKDMGVSPEILRQVYRDGKKKISLMEKMVAEGDFKGYTIEVHALKSVAASIGEMKLSEHAKEHEMAGKEGNEKFIINNYQAILDEYRELVKSLEKYDEQETTTEGREVTKEELDLFVRDLEAGIEDFDSDAVESVLNKFLEVNLSPAMSEQVELLREALEAFDFDKMSEIVTKFKSI